MEKLVRFWQALGSTVQIMDAARHDKVLAVTSHLPHLIAYTIVGTATDLEESERAEVVKFSAGGFRDFTRIAGSDPIMWRDVFLHNRESVLEMLQRFSEDLTALQRAIRWGEGETLEGLFRRTREIRAGIVDAHQAGSFDPREPERIGSNGTGPRKSRPSRRVIGASSTVVPLAASRRPMAATASCAAKAASGFMRPSFGQTVDDLVSTFQLGVEQAGRAQRLIEAEPPFGLQVPAAPRGRKGFRSARGRPRRGH